MTEQSLIYLCIAAFPIWNAISVFLLQRNAFRARKLLTFLLGLPLFILPCLFLFGDFASVYQNIVGETISPKIAGTVGLTLTVAYGIVYLGISAVICSERILKSSGIILLFSFTLLFFLIFVLIAYQILLQCADQDTLPVLASLLPSLSLPSGLANSPVGQLLAVLTVFYLICYTLSFLRLRKKADLRAEDIVRMHRIEEKERRIEKEGVCAVCRYAVAKPDDPLRVICDRKGEREGDARCSRFEYDPLKRMPEKSPNPPESADDSK